jgi:hypothetical protein
LNRKNRIIELENAFRVLPHAPICAILHA